MINIAETNPNLWQKVFDSKDILYCFNCGTCISGCPASEAKPPLLIRSLARMVILGLEDALLEEDTPWTCVTCSRCEEMCPMNVRPFELCLAIRRWQCKNDETRLPTSVIEIYKRGYTQPVEKGDDLRKSVGLVEKLPVITEFPELLKKFQAMLMETELVRNNEYMFRS